MPALDILTRKEDLAAEALQGRVCIVLDVLFATTTIVTALAHGAAAVWPALDRDEALAIAASLEAGTPVRLAGEYLSELLEGFQSPLPMHLATTLAPGDRVIYATTNGTLALRAALPAAAVYAAALVNAAATVAHVRARHPDADVLIVCSGSMGRFNLEDFRGAGELAAHFPAQDYRFSDTVLAALALRQALPAATALHDSRLGRMMDARGARDEVHYSAGIDTLDVVALLHPDTAIRNFL